jgi:hypothetical protein
MLYCLLLPPWTRAAVAEVLRAEEMNRAKDAVRS